jgi:hypothetical protein
MDNYVIEDFVGVFPNVVSKEFCERVIAHYENVKLGNKIVTRQSSEQTSQIMKNTDTYYFMDENEPAVYPQNAMMIRDFIGAFWACQSLYVEKYGAMTSLEKHKVCDSIKIQKTVPTGGYHVWHSENGNDGFTSKRLALIILYLNDVEEGGETEFLYQSKRIPAKQGTMMICPSGWTHTHRGNPPLKGDKYIMNSWLEYA